MLSSQTLTRFRLQVHSFSTTTFNSLPTNGYEEVFVARCRERNGGLVTMRTVTENGTSVRTEFSLTIHDLG
jgi:hypothetical protein